MKLDIQKFGGRGTSSSYGKEGYNTGGNNKPMRFYDKTDIYKGMTVPEFEKRVGKFKSEYIGLYNDDGKIIIAGTSFNDGSVAIPTTHPNFSKVNQMTHTHPSGGLRTLGGSLSGADVQNTAMLKFKGVRAWAKEKTYILRAKAGAKQNRDKLYKIATKTDKTWSSNANKRVASIKRRFTKQGKKMSYATENRIYLGYGTKYWKNSLNGTGYEYIEIKKKYRR